VTTPPRSHVLASGVPEQRAALPTVTFTVEQTYRMLVDHLPQCAVYVFDHDLRFLLAEGEAIRAAGISSMVGLRLSDIADGESLARLERHYLAALAGEEQDFEHPGEDGQRWYRVRIRPLREHDCVVAGLVVSDDITERRQAALDLAQSERRWSQLFAQATVGMIITEPGPQGAVLDVNDAFCALFESTRTEVLGWPKARLLSLLSPEAQASSDRVSAGASEGEVYETTYRRGEPEQRTLRVSISVIQDAGGTRVLSQLIDVSDQKRAEESLRSALAFQEAVLSVIPDPVHVADAALGTHVWTSKSLGRHLGYSEAELAQLDHQGLALVHPEDASLLADSVRRVTHARDGEVVQVRHRAMAADGSLRWIDRRKTPFLRRQDGTLEQYISITRDVTAEVAAAEELSQAHAFQEAVLLASPDIVSVFDLVKNQTVWVSRSLGGLMGYDLQEMQQIQSVGLSTILHPDDLADYQRSVEQVAEAADGVTVQSKTRVLHADGSWRVLQRHVTPFRRDEHGKVLQILNIARDITDQVSAEAELEDNRAFQQAVIATTPDLILLLDSDSGRPLWTSRELSELLGWTSHDLDALSDNPFARLVHPQDVKDLHTMEERARAAEDGEVVHGRYRAKHLNGSWRWLSHRLTPFARERTGEVTQLLTTLRDVTEVVEAQHSLEHAALHDPLTGLPNRRLVADRLRTALASSAGEVHLAVLFLDLDGFKRVNDAHGHEAGDAVLERTAERLLQAVRPGDTVGRMGGDEFVVLLVPRAGEDLAELAEQVGSRLRREVARPVLHADVVHSVTVSIGVAYATGTDSAEAVLRDADTAMYGAKTGGKDRLAVFDPEQRLDAVERAATERALRGALAADGIEVFYQPIVALSSGRLVGVEALLRVRGANGDYLDTQHAVLVAEQTGLIADIGVRVLAKACSQAVTWNGGLRVSVNLSARELAYPQLYERIRMVLDHSGLSPTRLELELTETVLLEAANSTVKDLERLRAEGVGIAIDDFGTGYASLRYLATLPVTCVKVDRSFTAGLGIDPVCRTLVHATIGLARDLGLECIVEGVETQEQLDALGCEEHVRAQGYLLGRPSPAGPTAPGQT
jgi:diguanylate cyclase (GGDEF)-like protein/PAS domain S-box-containing protein